LSFCSGAAGIKEGGGAGASPSESSCRVKGRRKGHSSFEAYVERFKRRKRIERKKRRKQERLEEQRFLSEFGVYLDVLAEEEISRELVEEFREQYSLREFYPIVLRRPLRSNPFKDAALASLERFLAEHDKGVFHNTGRQSRINDFKLFIMLCQAPCCAHSFHSVLSGISHFSIRRNASGER